MVKLNKYGEKIVEFIDSDINYGVLGKGESPPSNNDTELEDINEDSANTITSTLSGNEVTFTYNSPLLFNSGTVSEFGLFSEEGDFITRELFPEIIFNQDTELVIDTKIEIR